MEARAEQERERTPTRRTADDRFRDAAGRRLAIGLLASVAFHALALGLVSVTRAGDLTAGGPAPAVVILPPLDQPPPAVRVSAPRPPITRPAEPVAAPGFAEVEPEPPEWIPHDVPPRLLNTAEVVERLERRSLLPEEEEGERVVVLWMFVDRSGRAVKLRLQHSSGVPVLDAAAQDVATAMRFRPALFQGRPVDVWIVQPIRFSLRAGGDG